MTRIIGKRSTFEVAGRWALAMLVLALTLNANAREVGKGKFIVVLWEAGTPIPGHPGSGHVGRIEEPNLVALGGEVHSTISNRRIVTLPLASAAILRKHPAVMYVQRIWTGESESEWQESSHSGSWAAEAQSDTNLQWGPKAYSYDASGNITAFGTDTYRYDTAGRLISSVVHTRVNGNDVARTETFEYDAFGNLTAKQLSGSNPVTMPVDPATNRLVGVAYDVAGNVITASAGSNWGTRTYEFDALNMMTAVKQGTFDRRMIYDSNDERIGIVIDSTLSRWTIRDFEGQALREFRADSFNGDGRMQWEWEHDYVYGEGTLIAGESETFAYGTETFGGIRHYHLDHLGSVRMATDEDGRSVSEHDYAPFGNTLSKTYQEESYPGRYIDAMRFAGHARDFLGWLNVDNAEYLDNMHARHYDSNRGRFLSVDPAPAEPDRPQSWNRYSYVLNNPLLYTDPTGELYELYGFVNDPAEQKFFADLSTKTGLTVTNNNGKLDYARDANGNAIIATDANGKQLGSATARTDLMNGINSTNRFVVQRLDNSASVDIGNRTGALIRLDFADMGKINTGNNASATFDSAMIFLHEGVGHGFLGLKDPTNLQLQQNHTLMGATVQWENKIRSELGLPRRNQYRTETHQNGKRYIPFANGPVWLP